MVSIPPHPQQKQGYRHKGFQAYRSNNESLRVEPTNPQESAFACFSVFFFPTFFLSQTSHHRLLLPVARSVVYQLLVDEALDELIDDFSPRPGVRPGGRGIRLVHWGIAPNLWF